MKTAISLPDELFESVEKLVRSSKKHRSEIYAQALREYVARHSDDEITEALNSVVSQLGEADAEEQAFLRSSARQTFARNEW